MELDYLWRNVSARIYPYVTGDEEEGEQPKFLMFHIEVVDRGEYIYQRQIISERELELYPSAYGFILDKMVEMIDDTLMIEGHRDPIPRPDRRIQ